MRDIITITDDGCDRATAYHMSNKIVRRDDGVYITWLDSAYRIQLARVQPETGAITASFPLAQGFDNHCGAAMALGPDGVLHVTAGSHAKAFVYRYSATPADAASWSLPEAVGQCATYPSLICDTGGALHLAFRMSPPAGHWGMGIERLGPAGASSWPYMLVQAPAPLYSYPTNTLALAPDGRLHLVVEFYKTYPQDNTPPHSMAVAHLESPDGKQWFHTDGREVTNMPIRLEDTSPVLYKGGGDLRPSNVTVLPDNQPACSIWDAMAGRLMLAVRRADHSWAIHDLTPAAVEIHPGWLPCSQGQLALDPTGAVIVAFSMSSDGAWGGATADLHILHVDPASGQLLRHTPVPKRSPDAPDWLSSIEKRVGLPSDNPYLLWMSGRRGEGCVNAAKCVVRMMQVPS